MNLTDSDIQDRRKAALLERGIRELAFLGLPCYGKLPPVKPLLRLV